MTTPSERIQTSDNEPVSDNERNSTIFKRLTKIVPIPKGKVLKHQDSLFKREASQEVFAVGSRRNSEPPFNTYDSPSSSLTIDDSLFAAIYTFYDNGEAEKLERSGNSRTFSKPLPLDRGDLARVDGVLQLIERGEVG